MKIVTVKNVEADKRTDVTMKTLFGPGAAEQARVTMGMAVFPPGQECQQKEWAPIRKMNMLM